ncbi:hypothetical protein D3C78_1722110 [compost metagenome]
MGLGRGRIAQPGNYLDLDEDGVQCGSKLAPTGFSGVHSPVAMPRAGSLIHSLHEPAYNEPNG